MTADDRRSDSSDVDPRELLRQILKISPEDAEDVRRDSPATPARTRRKNAQQGQEGPAADFGED